MCAAATDPLAKLAFERIFLASRKRGALVL